MDAGHATLPPPGIAPGVVVITPVAEPSPSTVGTLESVTVGAGGLAVHVVADLPNAGTLTAQRVWVMARDASRLLAFQAEARPTRTTRVELSGVTAPVEERRRALVRSTLALDVEVFGPEGTATRSGTTRDLSRGGCRLSLSDGPMPVVGSDVSVRLPLAEARTTLDAEVLRVDQGPREVVLRFLSVPARTAAALDRAVLGSLL
jgi:c-di-GMP-binding flagellar brake protein YcgR